jgi:hypothetical protein
MSCQILKKTAKKHKYVKKFKTVGKIQKMIYMFFNEFYIIHLNFQSNLYNSDMVKS